MALGHGKMLESECLESECLERAPPCRCRFRVPVAKTIYSDQLGAGQPGAIVVTGICGRFPGRHVDHDALSCYLAKERSADHSGRLVSICYPQTRVRPRLLRRRVGRPLAHIQATKTSGEQDNRRCRKQRIRSALGLSIRGLLLVRVLFVVASGPAQLRATPPKKRSLGPAGRDRWSVSFFSFRQRRSTLDAPLATNGRKKDLVGLSAKL